jgi:hypothetical protein
MTFFKKKIKNTDPLVGAKLKSKTHLLNTFFDFLSLIARLASKVPIWAKKSFFWKKIKNLQKNAEFHADFESVEKVVKKCTKKVISKTSLTNMTIKVKIVHISITFLLITLFWCIYSKLLQQIWNQCEILLFWYPYWIFKWKIFFCSCLHFL